jgi:hypothetical protein
MSLTGESPDYPEVAGGNNSLQPLQELVNEELDVELADDQASEKSRIREWVFTYHNYTERDVLKVAKTQCRYICFARETCPTTGTLHLQGYVAFIDSKTFSAARAALGVKCWIRPRAKGSSPAMARQYICGPWEKIMPTGELKKKDANPTFYERGDQPQPGLRCDLRATKEAILSSKRKRDTLLDDNHTMVWGKYPKWCRDILDIRQEDLARERFKSGIRPQVNVRWSLQPDTGKTHEAEQGGPIRAKWNSGSTWFDGYDGHDEILFDEFIGVGQCSFENFKQWVDGFPVQLPVKGDYRWMLADKIWITSNVEPKDWWGKTLTEDQIKQLYKRFTSCEEKTERWDARAATAAPNPPPALPPQP